MSSRKPAPAISSRCLILEVFTAPSSFHFLMTSLHYSNTPLFQSLLLPLGQRRWRPLINPCFSQRLFVDPEVEP